MKENSAVLPWELPRYRNWLAVARVHRTVRRQLTEAVASLEIDLPRFDILATVYRSPGLAQTELAERLLAGRSSLTMLLPELEKRALISRTADDEDRRVRRVNLTPAGKRLTRRGLDRQAALVQHMFGALDEAECEALGDMMRRIDQYLEETPFSAENQTEEPR